MKMQILLTILLFCLGLFAENIDSYDTDAQFGWSENIGWIHFDKRLEHAGLCGRNRRFAELCGPLAKLQQCGQS